MKKLLWPGDVLSNEQMFWYFSLTDVFFAFYLCSITWQLQSYINTQTLVGFLVQFHVDIFGKSDLKKMLTSRNVFHNHPVLPPNKTCQGGNHQIKEVKTKIPTESNQLFCERKLFKHQASNINIQHKNNQESGTN